MFVRTTISAFIAFASLTATAQVYERFGNGGIDNRPVYTNPPPMLPPRPMPGGPGQPGHRPLPPHMSPYASYCDAQIAIRNFPRRYGYGVIFCAPTGFHLGGIVAAEAWRNSRGQFSIFKEPRGRSCACQAMNREMVYGISR